MDLEAEVTKLTPKGGDVLVVKLLHHVPQDQFQRITAQVKNLFPSMRTITCYEGEIEVELARVRTLDCGELQALETRLADLERRFGKHRTAPSDKAHNPSYGE